MVQGKKPLKAGEAIKEAIDSKYMDNAINREMDRMKRDPIKAMKTGQMIRMGGQHTEDFKTKDGEIIKIRSVTKFEVEKAILKNHQSIAHTEAFKMVYPKMLEKPLVSFELTLADSLTFVDGYMEENAWLIYFAIHDFYPDYSIEDVKKFDCFAELAAKVREISGLSEGVAKEVKSFLGDENGK